MNMVIHYTTHNPQKIKPAPRKFIQMCINMNMCINI